MKVDKRVRVLSVLLVLSGIALSSLVPGGPIENRDFSHIAPVVLLVFNIFLTALGLGSFLLVAGLMPGMAANFLGSGELPAGLCHRSVGSVSAIANRDGQHAAGGGGSRDCTLTADVVAHCSC